MQDYSYGIVGIVAFFVQLIINGKIMFSRETKERSTIYYRALLISIFAYYITDALWGVFSGMKAAIPLFIDTTIYFLAMGSIVVFWYCFIVEYLEQKGIFQSLFRYVGLGFVLLETICLIINCFDIPIFFTINPETAEYHECIARNIVLIIQIMMCVVSTILTIIGIVKTSGRKRFRNLAIFSFSIIMLGTIILQLFYSLYPIYAFGCLIGSCLLHAFVFEDEREELRMLLAKEKDNAEAANRAKSTFLFNMSHDIRTPMNAILGYSDRLINHIDENDIVKDSAEKIKFSGQYLLSLINDVLDMARIESDKIKIDLDVYDIRANAYRVTNIYEADLKRKNLNFVLDFDDITNTIIWYDSLKLRQIMLNLISNAIKYTPDGGTITHTMREIPSEKEGYGKYEIVVKDNGIGMSAEFVSHIFERFSRSDDSITKETQGTGLGMSIVGKLVDLMGGNIVINSELGKGTEIILTFTFKLASREEIEAFRSKNNRIIDSHKLVGLKVLLVDDNELNREIATDILAEQGVIVKDTAENGVIALGKISNAQPGDFDLVLMDVQMPTMDGYEATKSIRALENKALANIPIIAMTANAFEEDRQNALASGMNDHIAKPINIEKLKAALIKILGK